MPFRNSFWPAALVLIGQTTQAVALVVPAPSWPVGNAQLSLAGEAQGTVFDASQPGGTRTSGMLALDPSLSRAYDSGLLLALAGRFVAADPLSRGRYDGDAIEYLAASAQTGLGKLEIGLTDGAGYQLAQLAATDPKADPSVALEDPRTSFFRDPQGRAVTGMFAPRSEVGASSNYAKFVYVSPEVFGAQIALSFTPSEGKQLPFQQAGPHLPGRQADIWEAALRYSDDVGPVTVTAYGAVAEGRGEHKLPGQEGVSDLGAGLRADYPVNDNVTVSLGGSFRQSNAYAFDINQDWQAGTTRLGHVSAMAAYGDWRASVEYAAGQADKVAGLPRLALTGWEAALSRQLSGSIALTGGWQKLDYGRGNGVFFNGAPQLKLDAVFLHLKLSTANE